MGALVEWREKAKEPSKKGTDEKSGEKIPDEELDDAGFAGIAFFPGDSGMEKVGENGGEKVGDHAIKPEEFVVTKNYTGEEGIN